MSSRRTPHRPTPRSRITRPAPRTGVGGVRGSRARDRVDALKLCERVCPASPVLPIILGVATAAVGGATAAAFALDNRDLVQAMGGIAAFVIAGWGLVPPTPNVSAARAYASGRYVPDVSVAFTGNGLAVGGAF